MNAIAAMILTGAGVAAVSIITLMLATSAGKISDALHRRPIRKDR